MADSRRFFIYTDRTLVLLFLITFVMSLGMNSINPVWPLYIISLGATVFEASYVISLSGIVGTILRSPSGMASEKIGRRRIILASLILATIPPLFYMMATSWHELILWATMYGSAFALFMPTRNAWIADLVEPEERAAAYSFLNMAFPIGGVIGPILGGIVVDRLGWRTLFILATAIHGVSLLPLIAIRDPRKPGFRPERPSIVSHLQGGQMKTLLLLILLQFLFGFGFGIVGPMIPLYLTERFRTPATLIGIFSSIGFGVTAFLAQIPSARLAGRIGEGRLVLYCCSALPFTFLLWPSRTRYLELLLLYMLATAAWSTTWSSTASILMGASPSSRRGLFSGLSLTSIMLGFTAGPALAGSLWEGLGHHAPFYASSLIFATSVPIAFLLERSQRTP